MKYFLVIEALPYIIMYGHLELTSEIARMHCTNYSTIFEMSFKKYQKDAVS